VLPPAGAKLLIPSPNSGRGVFFFFLWVRGKGAGGMRAISRPSTLTFSLYGSIHHGGQWFLSYQGYLHVGGQV
jgi:hypothetical protein